MAVMYCKLFASLYQGTLRGKPHEILVFTNMLAHADAEGYVDKHFRAIADEVGLSLEDVKAAIACLEGPDDESRSPEQEGRRIVRVNDSRAWGWHVVNYGKYRAIKNDEDRRESNRKAQEKWREKQRKIKLGISDDKQDVSDSNHESSQSAQGEGDEEGKEEAFSLCEVVVEVSKRTKKEPVGDSRFTPFITAFSDSYLKTFGEKYYFQPKDAKQLQGFLKSCNKDLTELMQIVSWCWERSKEKFCPAFMRAATIFDFCQNWPKIIVEAQKTE